MPFEEICPPPDYCGAESETCAGWEHKPNYGNQHEAIPSSLMGMLELRAGLEGDLIRIRALVADMQGWKPVDLTAILNSLRYPDRLSALFAKSNRRATPTRNRFHKPRLLKWMSEFSLARQDAICSSVTLMGNISDAGLGLLLVLERYEHQTRNAIHELDESLLECEPQSVQEACGLLTYVGGLLAADTTIEYWFFATLVIDCVRTIETNAGIPIGAG